jgi:hypothetical protein
MKHLRTTGVLVAPLLLAATITLAAAPKEEPKEQDPSVPRGLEVRLVAKQATYTNIVDKKLVDEAGPINYPRTPEVDLVFELRNTAKQELHFRVGSDKNKMDLALKGPGAVSLARRVTSTTDEIRGGKIEKLQPGKTYVIPIKNLAYGFRGQTHVAYWTAAGEYTLSATFKTELGWKNDAEELLKLQSYSLKTDAIKLSVKKPS